MDLCKLLSKRITLLPRFANLHRRFDSSGFQIPLLDTLLDFLNLILLVAADRSQFAPASASQSQLFDLIAKLLTLGLHRLQLRAFLRIRGDGGPCGSKLTNDIDQRNPIESTR